MNDTKKPETGAGHEERVKGAFDALNESLGERLTDESRGSIERLREAAAGRDSAALKEELHRVKKRESWLYRELTEHPDVAALINELSIWGF